MTTGVRSLFCHPEPGPEASSGSIDFGISVFGFKNLGFKAPPLWAGFFTFHEVKKTGSGSGHWEYNVQEILEKAFPLTNPSPGR
jgi:hypothetical protein